MVGSRIKILGGKQILNKETSWSNKEVTKTIKEITTLCTETLQGYTRKIDTLGGKSKPLPPLPHRSPQKPAVIVRTTGPSAAGTIFMFMFGIFLGGMAAFYFWDQGKKALREGEQERIQLISEKRALVDTMTLLSETYYQLVHGNIRTIPQIRAAMAPIQQQYRYKRDQAEDRYNKKMANLRRLIPEGDRLDRSLGKLKKNHLKKMTTFRIKEEKKLEILQKQMNLHTELLKQAGK